ncbi:MAG: hypothetical protein U9N32_10645, partial [Spirochaetota bacterium]|nr:hypothetical protein [Spirochaetota bacterium]
ATGNNGRFVGVRENTKQAKNIVNSRPKKLFEAVKAKSIPLPIKSKEDAKHYLSGKSEKILDLLIEKKLFIVRAISKDEIKKRVGK